MKVKLRLGRGPQVRRTTGTSRAVALALAALLTPAALMACVLALWRLAADLKLTGDFAIQRGPFSHWQVWLAVAVVLELAALWLDRYGHSEPKPKPKPLRAPWPPSGRPSDRS